MDQLNPEPYEPLPQGGFASPEVSSAAPAQQVSSPRWWRQARHNSHAGLQLTAILRPIGLARCQVSDWAESAVQSLELGSRRVAH